ncbi:ClpP/crotonase-like domain-containing protein, partial [Jimgerdemannia flammicorona]
VPHEFAHILFMYSCRRHIDLLDTFGLPLLNLVDQPGFAVGTEAEKEAYVAYSPPFFTLRISFNFIPLIRPTYTPPHSTIRAGATALAAIYQSTIPIFSVILRRVFGVAGGAFVDNRVPNFRVAWPSGDWGSLPLEGGVEVCNEFWGGGDVRGGAAYKRQLAAAGPKREELKAQLLSQFESIRSPLRTAEAFDIPEIIDPRDTRKRACEWAHLIYEYVLPERLARRKAADVEWQL